jgi:hypothetical protein
MYFAIIILVVTLVVLLILFFWIKKNIKNIWQKIFFLYNSLYIIFIKNYYLSWKNKTEKEEILDFNTVILNSSSIDKSLKEIEKNEKFIKNYYSKYLADIDNIYRNIKDYEEYYYSYKRSLKITWLIILLLILLILVFIIK